MSVQCADHLRSILKSWKDTREATPCPSPRPEDAVKPFEVLKKNEPAAGFVNGWLKVAGQRVVGGACPVRVHAALSDLFQPLAARSASTSKVTPLIFRFAAASTTWFQRDGGIEPRRLMAAPCSVVTPMSFANVEIFGAGQSAISSVTFWIIWVAYT